MKDNDNRVFKYADENGTLWDSYADYVKYGDAFLSEGEVPRFRPGLYRVAPDAERLPPEMALPPSPRLGWSGVPV